MVGAPFLPVVQIGQLAIDVAERITVQPRQLIPAGQGVVVAASFGGGQLSDRQHHQLGPDHAAVVLLALCAEQVIDMDSLLKAGDEIAFQRQHVSTQQADTTALLVAKLGQNGAQIRVIEHGFCFRGGLLAEMPLGS